MHTKLTRKTSIKTLIAASFFTFAVLAGAPSAAQAETLRYDGPAISWPTVIAASAIVYDPVSNFTFYEKDADTVRPLASLSKLMTAAVVDDLISNNPNLAKKLITIKSTANENPADAKLIKGSQWLPTDLLKYMLIGSSNKAAQNLASQLIPESSFISLMNFKAKAWGLTSTSFKNASGLSTEVKTVVKGKVVKTEVPSGLSTARQAAHLLWNVLEKHPTILDITNEKIGLFTSSADVIRIENTDKILDELPIIAGKTGYTDLAGANLAVVVQPKLEAHPHVIVVLNSTIADRFKDVIALASSTPYILNITSTSTVSVTSTASSTLSI